jgi:hypothetical protein
VNEFAVLREEVKAATEETQNYNLPLPQWAIAVIVIGSASLIFILAFGVTMASLFPTQVLIYCFAS